MTTSENGIETAHGIFNINNNNVRIEDAGDITEYIEGVMVHPLAPQWYVKIIEDICKIKKIRFDGQSEIYTLKK